MSDQNQSEPTNASRQWVEELYEDLHRMASHHMRDEPETMSLSPTVLIHELFLRLPDTKDDNISRPHFFAIASTTMRRVLVDQARFRNRKKRGGGASKKMLEDWDAVSIKNTDLILAIDEAINDLAKLDERQAQVVEMRFFGGMTIAEIAEQLNVSKRTIESEWTMSKAWLRRRFDEESDGSDRS